MARLTVMFSIGVLLTLAIVSAVAAQTGALIGITRPFVVNIEQAVPVTLELAMAMEDGKIVTVTTPITVGVNLQVKVDGAQVVGVTMAKPEPTPVMAVKDIELPKVGNEISAPPTLGLPTSVPGIVNAEEILAHLAKFHEICTSDLTSAQKEAAVKAPRAAIGSREIQLTGTVEDVLPSMSGYRVRTHLDNMAQTVDVNNLPEEDALALAKGDKVLITGKVDAMYCGMILQISGTATLQ